MVNDKAASESTSRSGALWAGLGAGWRSARRFRACVGLAALLLQPLVGVPPLGAQGLGTNLTGGPYLDLMLATNYQGVWQSTTAEGDYLGVFYMPINLPPGYYPLGSFGHGDTSWSDKDPYMAPLPERMGQLEPGKLLVAKELQPNYLRPPASYRRVWVDTGSGAYGDVAMWEPIPEPGYVCLGTVATDTTHAPDPAPPPPLDAIRCVWNTLVADGKLATFTGDDKNVHLAPFYDSRGSGAYSPVQATRILPKDEHGPAFGIDVGTFRAVSTPADAAQPVYVLNSRAVAKLGPEELIRNNGSAEGFIQTFGPIIKLHPQEIYLPDSVEYILNNATQLCWGVIKNDGSYDNIAKGPQLCRQTSAANILEDDALARRDPQNSDPDFRTYLALYPTTPEPGATGPLGGNLSRAYANVRVKSTNQVFIDFQFWLYYPYNGPAKARLSVEMDYLDIVSGEVLSFDLSTDPTGRHHSDWEYVTLRLARATGCNGCTVITSVIGSAHDHAQEFSTLFPTGLLQYNLDRIGNHPVIYSAKDSHAHYGRPGNRDRGLASRTLIPGGYPIPMFPFVMPTTDIHILLTDYTADGGPIWDTSQPGKYRIISSEWPSIPATRPPWSFFQTRWGQYDRLNFGIPCTLIDAAAATAGLTLGLLDLVVVYFVTDWCPPGTTLPLYTEIGSGPTGPVMKDTWSDIKDTTPPGISSSIDALPGSTGWYRNDLTVRLGVSEAGSPFMTAGCPPSLTAVIGETAGTVVNCTAYSDGGVGTYTETFRVDKTPPSVPSGLVATAASASQINLTWTAATDSGSGLAGYKVERCGGSGCTAFGQIGTTVSNSFNDTNLSTASVYSYRLLAYDKADNNSGYSNTAVANVTLIGNTFALTVAKAGTGSGTVTGTGINCGSDCAESYPGGSQVSLAVTPSAGSTFAGWSGDCSSFGTQSLCTLTMNAAKNVTATFNSSSTASSFSLDYVQKAYVAYYGRPADPGGQFYWATEMDRQGRSLNAIIGSFGSSEEFNRRYGGLSYPILVTKIYQQALARNPDQGGLDYYVGELQAGRRTLQSITLDVLNGATTAPDSTVVANKLEVAAYYTTKVAAGCSYGTEQDGVNAILGVTAVSATVTAAKAGINTRCGP